MSHAEPNGITKYYSGDKVIIPFSRSATHVTAWTYRERGGRIRLHTLRIKRYPIKSLIVLRMPKAEGPSGYNCVCGYPSTTQAELDAHRHELAKVNGPGYHWPVSDEVE
jgi:hypothetical protein